MAQTIKLKRSATAGAIPGTSDLELGEIALNTRDGAVYIKKNDGSSDSIVAVHDNDILHIDTSNSRIGIGTTSPDRLLTLQGDNSYMWLKDAGGGNVGFIGGDGNNDGLIRLYNGSHAAKVEIQSDGDTYFNGGDVGIGTDSPAQKLEVVGRIRATTDPTFEAFESSTKRGGIQWDSSSDYTNIFSVGGPIRFDISGELARFDTSGNLMIGKTTQSGNATLTVKSPAGGNTGIMIIEGDTSDGWGLYSVTSDDSFRITQFTDSGTSYSDKIILDSSGNLGVGTDSPSANLDVVGGGSSTAPTLELNPSTSNTFNHAINAFNSSLTAGENLIIVTGKAGSTKNSGYIGYKWNGDADNSNLVTIGHWGNDNLVNLTADGKLGIGTESPVQKLHLSDGSSTAVYQKFSNDTTGNTSGDGTTLGIDADGDFLINNLESKTIKLYTADTERVRIDSSGNVGIGTTPSSLFHLKTSNRDLNFVLADSPSTGNVGVQLRAGASDYIGIAGGGGTGIGIVVDDSNNVGIGTSSPSVKLDVNGTLNATNLTIGGAQGSDGQVLTSTGSGVAWENATGGSGGMTSFQLEDGDGTEVAVSDGKEVKFVEGGGIDINWTDTDNGTDGDPYDLTFTVNAAQPNITSLGTLTTLTVDDITINGSTISDAADLTIDVGGDIIFDADGAQLRFYDGGTDIGVISNESNNLIIKPQVSDADFLIKGNDGGSTITALTLDMSDAGTASFNHDIKLADSGQAIFGDGDDLSLFHDSSHSFIHHNGTGALKLKEGSADAIVIDSGVVNLNHSGSTKLATASGGITVTGEVAATSLDISGDVDVDGTLEADAITVNGSTLASVIAGTTVSNATLAATTTVSDSTANTNFPVVFHDESNALLDDTGALTYNPSTGTFVVPNLNVTGTTTTVDTTTMTVTDKNIEIAKGAANDAAADGAGITIDSGDGDKTWNWVDSTNAWTSSEHIQVATDKVFGFSNDTNTYIDRPAADTIRFTTGGSEKVRINSAGTWLSMATQQGIGGTPADSNTFELGRGYLNLARDDTADAKQITFGKNGAVHSYIETTSSGLTIASSLSDGDILLKGSDGGSAITALTLDMSERGNATFYGGVSAYGNSDTVAGLEIYSDANHGMRILHRATEGDFSFERRVSGTNTEFLRIGRANGNATFAGTITSSDITITNAGPSLYLVDTDNNSDWQIKNGNGHFRVIDTTNSLDRLNIDTSGRVGIGTAGGAAGAKLHVLSGTDNNLSADISEVRFIGADKAITGEQANLVIQTNDDMAINKGGSIAFGGRHTTSSTNSGNFAHISGRKENSTSANYAGYLSFGTSDSASDITEAMRISSDGVLCIGDTEGWTSTVLDLGATSNNMRVGNTLYFYDSNRYIKRNSNDLEYSTNGKHNFTAGNVQVSAGGLSYDNNGQMYSWRAQNNSGNASNYTKIASVSGSQSTRFYINVYGRSSSYSDGVLGAMATIVGQINNDNDIDLMYYNFYADDDAINGAGHVNTGSCTADIYVQTGTYSELVAQGGISDGTLTPYSTTTGSSAPTNHVAASQRVVLVQNASGQVGINDTSPSDTLDVNGTVSLKNTAADAANYIHMPRGGGITLYGDANQHHGIFSRNQSNNSADDIMITSYGAVYIDLDSNDNNSDNADFVIGKHNSTSNNLFFIDGESEDVGIGTSSPEQKLHIRDTSAPASPNGSVIIEGQRDGTANLLELRARDNSSTSSALPANQGGIIRMNGFDGTDFEEMAFIGYQAEATVADGDAPSRLIFGTTTDGSGVVSEKMRIDNAGNIGIGTTSPTAKLHIHNTSTTSDGDGTADESPTGQDSILLYGHGGTNGQTYGGITWLGGSRRRAMISAVAENTDTDYVGLAFYTQGTDGSGDFNESMRIARNGNVGIGTTSPSFSAGSGLEISRAGPATLRLEDTDGTTGATELVQVDADGYLLTRQSSSLIFGTNSTEAMRITSGRETKFTVGTNKTVKFYAASHNDEGNLGAGLGFSRQSDGAELLSGIFGHSDSGLGIAARDHLTFLTGGSSDVSDTEERMRITSSGEVQIQQSGLVIEHGSTPFMQLKDTTNNVSLKFYAQDSNAFVGTTSSHEVNIGTNNTTAINITTSQEVTISNGLDVYGASPAIKSRGADSEIILQSLNESASNAAQFHVAHSSGNVQIYNARGNMRYYMGANDATYIEGDGNYMEINTASGYTRIGANNSSFSHFYTDRAEYYFNKALAINGACRPYGDDTHDLGNSSNNWRELFITTVTAAGDVTAYASDERLKTNIVKIDSAVEKVKQLRGVTFDWKDDVEEKGFKPSAKHETGVIAQEIQKIIPDAVVPAPFDSNYLTVKHQKIIPLLIEAIKEQQEEIEQLKRDSHPAKDMCDMKGYKDLVARIEKMEKSNGNN